ncbi:NUDIX hydrolase [Methylobacterium marchantiae]|uniref:NUDIX hydrolase n=1 Tax=Methylobacterium marchantiae TaxID=600331 RepID=A0ABW3WZP7_9HYPH|nr:hypothetical protein AIGOOFII_2227 [Methylobacterium marchantiae]
MSEGVTLTPIEAPTARLVSYDWAWARDNEAVIAENWNRRCAARPGLFDGRVLLASACRIEGAACVVDMFETAYASFIAHKDLDSPDPGVLNAFAAIVPHGADGAILLGVMGGHTANAGQIYFPCGTPDLDDVLEGGEVDLVGSAARELFEETGLTVPSDAPQNWLLMQGGGQLAFLRPVAFDEPVDVLQARMERHRLAETEPELSGFVSVGAPEEIDTARMPAFVQAYLRHALRSSAAVFRRS